MKKLLWYACCGWTLSLLGTTASNASPVPKSSADAGTAASMGKVSGTNALFGESLAQAPPAPPSPETPAPTPTPETPAPTQQTPAPTPQTPAPTPETPAPTQQTPPPAPTPNVGAPPTAPVAEPSGSDTKELQDKLKTINNDPASGADKFNTYQPRVSPGFSISNPTGFGADRNLFFFGVSYQNRTRFSQTSDAEAGFGVGLGDAVNSVGVELSYSINSFGSSQAFGSGAFNAKIHKRLSEDTSVAIGWNQFASINFGPGRNGNNPFDYPKNSYYASATKILRTCEDINQPFCRIALTAGVGSGVFLPADTISAAFANGRDATGLNVFGSVGVRVARPISAVVEWTGQDLAAGLSIAPFEDFPLVITPAVRDITGAGDGARFILGAGVAFNF